MHGAKLTFIRFVPDSAPMTQAQSEADYLDQARSLCEIPSDALIVRGPNKAVAIGNASAAYDLLVTAEVERQTFWGALRGTGSDKLTEAAGCSVLRLQGPRGRSAKSLSLKAALSEFADLRLQDCIEPSCIKVQLAVDSKRELFDMIAHTFAATHTSLIASDVVAALWEREQMQNTAAGMGLALPHATVPGVGLTPSVGIVTTSSPVDYETSDARQVDVFFVTLGSPEARFSNLVVMSAISKVVLETSLLKRLRSATNGRQVRSIIEESSAEIDWSKQH
jgi:mannitol/fructose-specific phosphotransferase system IIA component (Ntr-type)